MSSKLRPYQGRKPNRKFAREILRRLPGGYQIAYGVIDGTDARSPQRVHGAHPYLFSPDGHVVYDRQGMPITVPSTPSDHRVVRNILARVRGAGITIQ